MDDGRYNNNGWLHELPDPVTKMVWENVILLSKKTADDLSVEKGKEVLRGELKDLVNETLKKEEVKRVYFTQFVIQ